MKNIKRVIVVVVMIIIWGYKFPMYSEANEKIDMFSEIINETQSQVVEYGLKGSFSTQESGEKVCNAIFNNLNYNKSVKVNIEKSNNNYYIDFSSPSIEGYIQSIGSDNDNIITLSIKEYSGENNLTNLNSKVKSAIEYNNEIVFFRYIKAKAINCNLEGLNKQVVGILKSFDTNKISITKINNGLSVTANTHQYNELNVGGEFIDFNYALCNYSTGNYIILATPIIPITY